MAGRPFTSQRALAQRLIQRSGRLVNIVQESKTQANPAEPWEGSDPTAAQEVLAANVNAVFTNYSPQQAALLGVQRGDRRCLIAADDLPAGFVLDTTHKIVDSRDGIALDIVSLEVVQPGEPVILYKAQVRA